MVSQVDCAWVEGRLALLHYGELGEHERERALTHLAGCGRCQQALAAVGAGTLASRSRPMPGLRHAGPRRVTSIAGDTRTSGP